MLYDADIETLDRNDIELLQLKRLQQICKNIYANVPFYKEKFDHIGLNPNDIKSLNILNEINFFTEKQDLRDNYPFGLFAVPKDKVVRLHASSGTTGKSTVVGYTAKDLDTWAILAARCLSASGVKKGDILHNAYGYGLFTGGLGIHYGVEKLGATVVPISGGATKRQIQLLKDFEATVLTCTPSYALFLHEAAIEAGINISKLPLRIGIFGAEPWTEEMRKDIQDKMGITAVNIYGLSEIMGPGVAQECAEEQFGMHIFEDHFLPEIIDPATGKVLPEGEIGELVITTLTKEAIPLFRYRTRDITSLNYKKCSCGRTHARINRILGRSDDMLIVRGVNVYPQQIEAILVQTEGVSPHYEIVIERKDNLDILTINVEFSRDMFLTDEVKKIQTINSRIQKAIKDFLGVTATVHLVEPKTLQRFEGKANRVKDLRK